MADPFLPTMVNDGWGAGIVLAYVWKEAPFITVLVLSALRGSYYELMRDPNGSHVVHALLNSFPSSLLGEVFGSADAKEGAIAFAEKRQPNWQGK